MSKMDKPIYKKWNVNLFFYRFISFQITLPENLSYVFLPIRSDENDPFIIGLDRIKIATTFPTTPKVDTIDNKTPSIINVNIIEQLG